MLIDRKSRKLSARKTRVTPIAAVHSDDLDDLATGLPAAQAAWVKANGFTARSGETLLLPGDDGDLARVLFGLGGADGADGLDGFLPGRLSGDLPDGIYAFEDGVPKPALAALGWMLNAYRFDRYKKAERPRPKLVAPEGVDARAVRRVAEGAGLARDLINTPAEDMGPQELETAVRRLARGHDAKVKAIKGNELVKRKFPLIHTVGRASDRAPRLIDLVWGAAGAPKVTLVGKGVCFDTGGLNLKPGRSMALMKKDMGGAANVLGLASMIMAARLPVRLRVLIPAVDNNVSANAFRPGDVLPSRNGMTVEIGNTDAEGRLVLADALTLADAESPELLIDMATLTGAARVALGPDLPPFYTDDDDLAETIAAHGDAQNDPIWRMPLWSRYDGWLDSKIADVNHISEGGFAGSVTAALFLKRFVSKAGAYVHFDIFAWTPTARPGRPMGGEAQAIRALFAMMSERYGN
ncbi:MAG: leucyl aminopeptidase family protein [Hyphomicrobiales bacterium]